jgi:hypothetical protein
MKHDHADDYCRQHQFQDSKVGEQELSGDYIIIGDATFLEEKTERDSEKEPEHDLSIPVFMESDEHHSSLTPQ